MKKLVLFSMLLFTIMRVFSTPAPANEAFQLSVTPMNPNLFQVNWTIKNGYFLYKNRIKLQVTTPNNIHLGTLHFPPPLSKPDKQGGVYPIYRDQLTIPVDVLGKEAGESIVNVHFQGCSDEGFCYPPQNTKIKLSIDNTLALTGAVVESPDPVITAVPDKTAVAQDKIEALFTEHTWPLILLSFFGFGLLLSFTPCILPMVPVLSSIIVGHGANISTRKAFALSLTYVISMSLTYGLVGAMIALMGSNLQVAMQSTWSIALFGLLFVLLALSMFNVYELKLPLSWQNKLAGVTRSQASGHYASAAVMGSMSTLILSPCVTAPMIGALGYIARTGNTFLGLWALFFLGLGMGTPLLFIGASAGKFLPKAGRWMNDVKAIFGVLLLGVAIHLLSRILPGFITMLLWACLFVFTGIYAGALKKTESHRERFQQGMGILLLVYGLLILIGASLGNNNPIQPLASLSKTKSMPQALPVIVAKTVREVQTALASANGKPVILDFYADWCSSCKFIEKTTLQNATLQKALKDFTVVKVDLTKNDQNTRELLHYFGVVAPPTFLFYNAQGRELPNLRIVGEVSINAFFDKLKQV